MRRRIIVIFNPKRSEWSAGRQVLAAIGHGRLAKEPQREFGYTLKFDNEPDYERFVAETELRGLPAASFFTRRETEISPRELESPLVWLQVTGRPRGLGGPTYGTEYDLGTGCPKCGTGAPQISPLYVKPSDAPRSANVWQTLDNEILMAPAMSAALGGSRGLEMRQVRSADGGGLLPWFQLIPLHELPPMAPSTVGTYQTPGSRFAPCPVCMRDGFFTRMSYTIRYELELEGVPDVSHTYEYFGRSVLAKPFARSHFAKPLPIVRGHIFERLLAAGARHVAAEPLEILDTSKS